MNSNAQQYKMSVLNNWCNNKELIENVSCNRGNTYQDWNNKWKIIDMKEVIQMIGYV